MGSSATRIPVSLKTGVRERASGVDRTANAKSDAVMIVRSRHKAKGSNATVMTAVLSMATAASSTVAVIKHVGSKPLSKAARSSVPRSSTALPSPITPSSPRSSSTRRT